MQLATLQVMECVWLKELSSELLCDRYIILRFLIIKIIWTDLFPVTVLLTNHDHFLLVLL